MIPVNDDQQPDQQPDQQSHNQHHPHTFVNEETNKQARRSYQWFKSPNIAWILCAKMLLSLSLGIGAGPNLEIFTEIICRGYYHDRPNDFLSPPSGANTTASVLHNNPLSLVQATGYSSDSFGSCTGDPLDQVQVAKVGSMFAIIGGILSFFTIGWWGGYMDRYGRTRILVLNIFVVILHDFLTLIVFFFPNNVPGGYWILVITPIMEGVLGTPSTLGAAETAYMRDVSEPHELSRNFSFLISIFPIGGVLGPIIGSFIAERTGAVITVLYATTIVHLLYASIVWFLMPESVSDTSMIHARNRYASKLVSAIDINASPFRRRILVFAKAFWDSFPLYVLAPKRSPNPRWKLDCDLTLLALSAGLINVIMVRGEVFQYGLYNFKWSSVELGYFISASGLSTAIFLTTILPIVVSVLKRAPANLQHTESARRDVVFDLILLRVSSLTVAAGYALMAFAPTGLIFTLCYMITSFGQGFIPAVQSIALNLYANASGQDNAGRLLSAMDLCYGLGARLFGPIIFGAVFANTVSFFPTAIFWTAVACALTIFLLLGFIRLSSLPSARDPDAEERNEDDPNPEMEPLLAHA
ncbi:MFS general substrate transporter [Imleria badia]|nr:MFS general substrate transporter [Imleria badia]